jgi:hypothetical protein
MVLAGVAAVVAFSSAVLQASTNTDDATVPTKMALMESLLFIKQYFLQRRRARCVDL